MSGVLLRERDVGDASAEPTIVVRTVVQSANTAEALIVARFSIRLQSMDHRRAA